jgi:hypothetical protein
MTDIRSDYDQRINTEKAKIQENFEYERKSLLSKEEKQIMAEIENLKREWTSRRMSLLVKDRTRRDREAIS